MQHQQQSRQKRKLSHSSRIFTASEVAEYEYCPLVWWYEQYETLVTADTEELFARTVALEHDHGPQATMLPEYQVIEQVLLRRGAFERGKQQHLEHAQAVAEIAEEYTSEPTVSDQLCSTIRQVIIAMMALALVLMIASWLCTLR
jgi:hypothetical protein